MGDLLLIRHGETEWSRSGRHTSYTDLSLTQRGREQAAAVGPLLTGRRIALALVSPAARAVQTAQLAGLDQAETERDLVEWNYGGYEGITTLQIRVHRPDWYLWTHGVAAGSTEHPGESPEQVGARADRVLARLDTTLRDPDAGDVVLVAHGHVLRVLAARRLGLHPSAGALFRLDTATLSSMGTEHGRWTITAWNTPAAQCAPVATPARPRALAAQGERG